MAPVTTTVTCSAEPPDSAVWRYLSDRAPRFDARLFDIAWLENTGLVAGHATAGRGSTRFLHFNGHALVLRQYRRGGMVRHVSKCHYVWQGLEHTRAMREFEILRQLEVWGLPAPRPYACEVRRSGFLYTASLITHLVRGHTLAECLSATGAIDGSTLSSSSVSSSANHHLQDDAKFAGRLSNEVWAAIGVCVRRFHDAGVWHADLNAHNILINGTDVALLDFDRACLKPASKQQNKQQHNQQNNQPNMRQGKQQGKQVENTRWQAANLQRLHRSLNKVTAGASTILRDEQWQYLMSAYNEHER